MSTLTVIGIAFALAMDAFAVAIAVGARLERLTFRRMFRLSFHFGLFQFFMPIIGWAAGTQVSQYVSAFDHWVAAGLLWLIGGKMIYEAISEDETRDPSDPTRGMTMVMLSIATSIDALAVGLTLGMLGVSVWFPALIIGLVAGGMTLLGIKLGGRIGSFWGKRVEIIGGLVLISIGIKILAEHTLLG